ncbi:MAG TPA: peptide-methionine (S)-S-oxide reductase MsrA [Chitinophagales bacterium]|nr:peptide-methionine (S)-S-oxide reductase MsrA [Chitinophagales bacterium]
MRFILGIIFFSLVSCSNAQKPAVKKDIENYKGQIITLGGGCFWCTEALFQRLEGVDTVVSGYMGGRVKNPTYNQVSSGQTGHAEVIQVYYNPDKIALSEIFEVFFTTHDPTTLNRQGADIGTQYRSVIYYENENQKASAQQIIKDIDKADVFPNKVVTEVSPISTFYPAEDYHQNYYNLNGNQPYCSIVIAPKIKKLEKLFKDKLK